MCDAFEKDRLGCVELLSRGLAARASGIAGRGRASEVIVNEIYRLFRYVRLRVNDTGQGEGTLRKGVMHVFATDALAGQSDLIIR